MIEKLEKKLKETRAELVNLIIENMRQKFLVADDSYPHPRNPDMPWCVFGEKSVLSGSMFYRRANAIKYAEEILKMPWRKAKRMGYSCRRVKLSI